jgi:hypothetical protein
VRDFAEHEWVENNRRQLVWPRNRSSASQSGRRDRDSITTDFFGHRVIADLLPHPTRMIEVRKKDGQLRKPEFFGLRGSRNPVSVNFDPVQFRPMLVAYGRVPVIPTICSSDITRTKRLLCAGIRGLQKSNIASYGVGQEEELSISEATIQILLMGMFSRRALRRFAQRLLEFDPRQQRVERRAQGLSPVREAVVDLGRDLGMNEAPDDAISFHLAQLLNQHFFRHGRHR